MQNSLGLVVLLVGEEEGVNLGENATVSNGGAVHELVKLFVVADGQLDVAGHNSGLLVVQY